LGSGPTIALVSDAMARTGTHIEIDLCEWNDEQTVRFDFDKAELTPDDRLVVGYLLLEEHGLFADLPIDEQQRIVRSLRS
jgi:hypothetical protein